MSDEQYQVKELLSGTFKFPDAPSSNKLVHLKDVHKWLFKIRQSFRKYANFYMTGSQIICHLFYVKALNGVINGVNK